MYVLVAIPGYRSPPVTVISFHCSFDSNTLEYRLLEHFGPDGTASTASLDFLLRRPDVFQIDRLAIAFPLPSGSFSRSISVVPANAYATTSGGLAR